MYNVPNTPGSVPRGQSMASRSQSSLPVSFTLVQETKRLVQEQLIQDWSNSPVSEMRLKLLLLDLAYAMESSAELRNSEAQRIITTVYKELELPVLQPNIDAAHAYQVGIFLSGYPIFGVIGESKERTEAAKQMESIIEENSRVTGWKRQLSLFFKNGLKYNVSAVEVDWHVRRSYNLETDTNISLTEASKKEIFRAGNEIRSLDMYNTAWDTSVAPADVHTTGDYTINVERLTLAQLHSRLADLKANGGILMGEGEQLWRSGPRHNWHYIPPVQSDKVQSTGSDWISFFTTSSTPMTQDLVRKYEWITYYRRIIPSMFKMGGVSDPDMVQIWKFVEVNGVLLYAERKSNAHNYLPTVFSQPIEDGLGLQTKGMGSTLMPFQNLSSTMFRARIASLARALSDRGLYDPSRISAKDINSQIPTAKIPVRPSAYGKNLAEAYHQIPYDDRNGQMLYGDIGQVQQWAADAAHINKSQRGQHTKGNRTLAEYQDVQDNADSTQYSMSLLLEEQAFVPIKYIVKTNILQYQTSRTLTDPNTKTPVEVDPVELRKSLIEFKLSDGLLPKDKIMGLNATLEAFQIMGQFPEVNEDYDLVGMLVETMEAKGARIAKHKRTPEEQQARLQRQQQANGVVPPGVPAQAPVA